jgi:hypothetical protein
MHMRCMCMKDFVLMRRRTDKYEMQKSSIVEFKSWLNESSEKRFTEYRGTFMTEECSVI